MKHVVSISDLSKKQILSILKRAKELVPVAKGKKKSKSLDGKILATCFFEPSTRTRLSSPLLLNIHSWSTVLQLGLISKAD